ncbi:MAG: hypothetical protein QM496_02405 [Verrucomicrobiota bacterium]
MDALRDYEIELIRRMIDRPNPEEEWLAVDDLIKLKPYLEEIDTSKFLNYEYTVVGYFVTVSHPKIPNERLVLSAPRISYEIDGNDIGFVLFFEDGELMIDCHALSEHDCPINSRDRGITIRDERDFNNRAEQNGVDQAATHPQL